MKGVYVPLALLPCLAAGSCLQHRGAPSVSAAAARAARFLEREVRRWRPENGCHSCHNNGDAARALYRMAALRGDRRDPIPATTRWLQQPSGWKHNGGEGPFADERLARLQFAAALREAETAGVVQRRLAAAADEIAADQLPSGAWQEGGSIGSPITWGAVLATHFACEVLRSADPIRYRGRLHAAERWLAQQRPRTVLDAAAKLLALGARRPDREEAKPCLAMLARGQAPDGGWGPYVDAPSEAFDTALALLALRPYRDEAGLAHRMLRGRGFLLATQGADGGWPETTRPAGHTSYAHRISTTAWALQGLLATRSEPAAR